MFSGNQRFKFCDYIFLTFAIGHSFSHLLAGIFIQFSKMHGEYAHLMGFSLKYFNYYSKVNLMKNINTVKRNVYQCRECMGTGIVIIMIRNSTSNKLIFV